MQEIVVHHNDLNQLILPDFKEQEYNVFANMIFKLNNKGKELLEFSANEISKWFGNNYNYEQLTWLLRNMAESMRKKGFVHISKVGKVTREAHITMFPTFIIDTKPNPKFKNDPMLKNTLKSLKVRVNKDFVYLFNELKNNFTEYELEEFVDLEGKYTKRLYMLLKQYRNTGKCLVYKNRWDDFCKLLNIPETYPNREIERVILKPAIKELSKERNLFSGDRVVFENLTYEKIKSGRGGKVTGIIFTFKSQKDSVQDKKIQELESELEIVKNREQQTNDKYHALVEQFGMNREFGQYINFSFCNKKNETIQIKSVYRDFKGINVQFENKENGKSFPKKFESEKHIDNYLKKFRRIYPAIDEINAKSDMIVQEPKPKNYLNQYIHRCFHNQKENHTCKITDVNECGDDKHIVITYTDMDTNEVSKFAKFENESQLQKWLEKWEVK